MYDNDRLLKDLAKIEAKSQDPEPEAKQQTTKPLFNKISKISAFATAFLLVFFVFFYLKGSISDQSTLSWINRIPIIGQIKQFAESSSSPLRGEERGRINVLLLGIGGKGHDGSELTDTMIAASLDVGTK